MQVIDNNKDYSRDGASSARSGQRSVGGTAPPVFKHASQNGGGGGDRGLSSSVSPEGTTTGASAPRSQLDTALLEVRNLRVSFHTYAGDVKALDGVEFTVRKGEVVGLVGESGCGKSVTSLAIAGLLPGNARIQSGEILLNGSDLLGMRKRQLRSARLKDLAIVFQDPTTYLNPVLTIGSQLTEIMVSDRRLFARELVASRVEELTTSADGRVAGGQLVKEDGGAVEQSLHAERVRLEQLLAAPGAPRLSRNEFRRLAARYAVKMLRRVRLASPERVFRMYPFELSGGMKQRAMIAMALVRRPKIFLADEITTALDVTVQAQILKLLRDLRAQIDTSVILITHDLAVVAEVCDRVAVMYAGNIVEVADVGELFKNPLHPYTKGLLGSIPRPDSAAGELKSIAGSVPNLIRPPTGCRFHPRCPMAFERCIQVKPPLVEVTTGHFVECLLYGG